MFTQCQRHFKAGVDLCTIVFSEDKDAEKKERQSTPHLWNLNPDPQLTGMIVQMIKPGKCSFDDLFPEIY